ncbi:LuxR C-terminal-related transcriptional regulator [Klebsiella pneumoniae subsp. pneumoniae]|nr:LuxR C-terminal-related transcriptional regulator [Klebsiella pneumoniae subsp. pneumoniae]
MDIITSLSHPYNPTPAENKILSLSEQEIKIMRYILSGAPNQNIAAEMNINPKTVSTYKREAWKLQL